jgi:hypothetical protein
MERPSKAVNPAPSMPAADRTPPRESSASASCSPSSVAVLFARADSIYKTMEGCDVWDIERDALNWQGGAPIVGHPPCRAWAGLAHMAKPRQGEKELAIWCVDQIRKWGGVLEHPAKSKLWPVAGLPEPGKRDAAGGWTLPILQWWWGHRAEKATRLYICGCEPSEIPEIPFRVGYATHVVNTGHGVRAGMPSHRPHVSHKEREATPPALAAWLVEVARICRGNS